MEKLRFGLVGCGRISNNHFKALEANGDKAKLVAVCDIDETRAKTAAKENGCDYFLTLSEMLKREDLDVVSVCTPSGLHPEHGRQIAKAKKHVLSEKPIGVQLDDALALIETCEAEGVKLFAVHQNRYNNTIAYLKKAIGMGRFGKIYNVQSNVFWNRPQSYYDADAWKGSMTMDGGAFMNQAIHYVDALLYLVGDVSSVTAFAKTQARDIESPDSGVVAMAFENGALGSMNVSMLTYPKNLEGSITILGETGTVKIGGVAINKIEAWEFETPHEMDAHVLAQSYETGSVYGFGHTGYYKKVIESIENDTEPPVSGREGYRSIELVCAIHQAAFEGRVVKRREGSRG